MKHFALSASVVVAAFGVVAAGALAATRPAQCALIVKGKTYIDGECQFEADPDGSFRIFGKDYFAYVNVSGKTAEASWNGEEKATHAHDALGTLTRKGACWENAAARICARDLPPAQRAAAIAAQPKGEMIYPSVGGASGSCVAPRGGKWVEGAELTLDNCPGDGSANRFMRESDTIRVDKTDGLCVGVARAAGRATAVLRKCGEAETKWTSSARSAEADVVRSKGDECWSIPKLADDKAIFPFEVVVAPCDKSPEKRLKFYFEKP